jgi:hypothetical protein
MVQSLIGHGISQQVSADLLQDSGVQVAALLAPIKENARPAESKMAAVMAKALFFMM